MTKKLWYLAGPICHVKGDSDRAWRDEFKKTGLGYIDPFDEEEIGGIAKEGEPSPKEKFNKWREKGMYDKVREEIQPILQLDQCSVARCFGVLAYSPDPSWGTIRECSLAFLFGKPIVLWVTKLNADLSNTAIGIATELVWSFNDAVQSCKFIERYGP